MFQVDLLATDTFAAVSQVLEEFDAIPGLNVTKININGRSYSASRSSVTIAITNNNPTSTISSDQENSSKSSTTSMIVGLVVGLGGGLLLVVGLIWAYRIRERILARRCNGIEGTDRDLLTELDENDRRSPRVDSDANLLQSESIELSPKPTRINSTQSYNRCKVHPAPFDRSTSDLNDLGQPPPFIEIELIAFD